MSTIIEGTTNNPETADSNSIGCKLYFSSKTHHQSAANSSATIMPATATIYSLHCITFFLKNWHGLHKHQLKPRLVGPYTGIHTVLGLKLYCIKVRLSLVIHYIKILGNLESWPLWLKADNHLYTTKAKDIHHIVIAHWDKPSNWHLYSYTNLWTWRYTPFPR